METTYAYLAGTIDADGFISVGKKVASKPRKDGVRATYYVVKIGLSETSPIVPALLQETFPAWHGSHQPKNPKHKRWYVWQSTNRKAREPLVRLLPYLRIKQRQAELALALIDVMERQSVGRNTRNPLSKEQIAEREALYDAVTKLNAPRNRRKHLAA